MTMVDCLGDSCTMEAIPNRVIISGSRYFSNEDLIRKAIIHHRPVTVIHGAHWCGADWLADVIAIELNIPIERHRATWSVGRSAGPQRNQRMVDSGADLCLAFIVRGVESPGTWDTIQRSVRANIPTHVIFSDV